MKQTTKKIFITIFAILFISAPSFYPQEINTEKEKPQAAPQKKEINKKKKQYNLFTYHSPTKNNYPAELTMMIIDLKYNDKAAVGEQIKICELGDGFTSRYKGFDSIYGLGAIWSRFWTFLKTFEKPVWFIDMDKHARFGSFYALDDFYNTPGVFTNSMHSLEANPHFRMQKSKNRGFDHRKLSSYANFVVKKYGTSTSAHVTAFRLKNPASLIFSEASRRYTNNKYRTAKLFESPSLKAFRPKSGIYRKQYYPELAPNIIKEFGCEMFVIKPINAALGNGIIMVHKKDLDDTLNKILKQTKDLGKHAKDSAYTYWRRDRNRIFIIEEYAPSKPILVNREAYDATMRIVLSAWNDNGHVNLTFLGAYWKLPMYPLNQPGISLTDMHKSQVKRGRVSSAAVDQEDFDNVIALLCQPLTKVYTKMLKNRSNRRRYRYPDQLEATRQPQATIAQDDAMNLFKDACLESEEEI